MSSSPTLPDPADRATQRDENDQYYLQVLLGLDPHRTTRGISPWKRRRPQDVRALCARAAKPSAVD